MPAKKPEDRRKKRDPFPFIVDGVEYEFRPPSFGALADMQAAENETVGLLHLIRECTSEDAYAAIRSLEATDVNDLFTDWMGSFGATAGKSSGSSE